MSYIKRMKSFFLFCAVLLILQGCSTSSSKPEQTPIVDRDAIDAEIRSHKAEFIYCIKKMMKQSEVETGKMRYSFLISKTGQTKEVKVIQNDFNDPSFTTCVTKVVQSFQFPAPKDGLEVTVKYPFQFSSTN